MAKTWVLVAHDAGARVFESRGPGKGIELVETIDHPEGRVRDRDIKSDRPGRAFQRNPSDVRRSSMSSAESPHERAASDFARELAAKLQHARTEHQYERLVLVAPPRFLGLLRSSLDGPTAQLVVGSLDKDLASSGEKELLQRLGELIAV